MKKNKPKNYQWLGILIYMLIGAASGVLILGYMETFQGEILSAAYDARVILLLLAMYAALTAQLIIHEAGHLVFGLATGYRFISFRVFSFMFIREGGRVRCKRLSLAGTGGQCLMAPPDLRDGKMPFMMYNLGGSIMNLIASAVCLIGVLTIPPASAFSVIMKIMAVIGVAFALMNGVPLRLGPVDNDGRNALSLTRSPEAVRAFWIQLKANELVSQGVRFRDMPAEWFTVPDDSAMCDGITATLGVMACNRLMDEHRFSEADALLQRMLSLENGPVGLHRAMMTCDRMYIELAGPCRSDVLEEMMTPEQKKLMKAMKDDPTVLRTEYARALRADHDPAKASQIEARFERRAAKHPHPIEIEAERELMRLVRDKSESGEPA